MNVTTCKNKTEDWFLIQIVLYNLNIKIRAKDFQDDIST